MKYCNPQPFGIYAVSCLFKPIVERKFKANELPLKIINIVSHETGIREYDIMGKQQKREFCDARSMAMKLIYEFAPKISQTKIGSFFNKRDHSTVSVAMDKCNDLVDTDKVFALSFKTIKERIEIYLDNIPK